METGVSDGTNPMASITREQLAAMLYRYAGSPAVTGSLSAYPDAGEVSDWAVDAMVWATEEGIINGMGGKLSPRPAPPAPSWPPCSCAWSRTFCKFQMPMPARRPGAGIVLKISKVYTKNNKYFLGEKH